MNQQPTAKDAFIDASYALSDAQRQLRQSAAKQLNAAITMIQFAGSREDWSSLVDTMPPKLAIQLADYLVNETARRNGE